MTFRFYRPGDEHALARLFEEVYRKPMSAAEWRWKLLGRPGDLERVVLAEEAGEPVFQVGGIPCAAVLGGRPATVVVAVDAMTRPDHRRRGLLTGGYRELFAHWRERGVALVVGMPNEQHGLRVSARGWRPLFRLRWRVRLLRPERILARRTGVAPLGRLRAIGRIWNAAWGVGRAARHDVSLQEGAPDDAELDALWERCRGDAHNALVRDAAWFRWRYRDAPRDAYRLLCARRKGDLEGVLVQRLREDGARRVAYVAEMLVPAGEAAVQAALISGVVERSRSQGAELIATLVPEGAPRERILARHGFLASWGAFTVACVPLGDGVSAEVLSDPRGWSLEGGCFDVV